MKKLIVTQFLFFVLFFFVSHFADAQTVYVTEKGKKYHKKNCTVVSEGKKGMDLKEAKKAKYEACNVCKPEATVPEKKKVDAKSSKS